MAIDNRIVSKNKRKMLGIIALLPSLKCAFFSCALFDAPKERTNYERVITVIVLLTSFNFSFKSLLKKTAMFVDALILIVAQS